MSKFRKKSKINVGGKLPVSSVVAVMTAFQKELSVYSQGYTQSKDIWKMYSEGVSRLDDALVSWGYKVDNIEKDVSVMISFVNSDTPRVEVVSDKAKCLLLVSTGYLVSLARRIATMNTNNEVSPSVIKMLDLILFVRQSGLDVFETSTYDIGKQSKVLLHEGITAEILLMRKCMVRKNLVLSFPLAMNQQLGMLSAPRTITNTLEKHT